MIRVDAVAQRNSMNYMDETISRVTRYAVRTTRNVSVKNATADKG